MFPFATLCLHPSPPTLRLAALTLCATLAATSAHAQGSGALGNGLSAAATARGGSIVTEHASPLDAVEGNPAGLAGISAPGLDATVLGLVAGGTFNNAVNHNAKLTGIAAAMPSGAFATPIGRSPWVAAAAFTPEVLMRANWHYNDAPGTAGVTYGYQKQETQIIAVRSSLGIARSLGPKWSVGATVGIVYNQNGLHAPYIFQQEPHLQGLKVLLSLTTRGYGWNGGAGVQFAPNSRLRTGLSWKSGTTIRTQGNADGSASALFTALGLTNDPTFHYHAQVQNDLPQAFSGGLSYTVNPHVTLSFQGDFTGWHTAFAQLPIDLTQGTNPVINSVVGSNAFHDAVPLRWHNQGAFHAGAEMPVTETWTVRAGYQYASNPVPAATLIPLTSAIMQQAIDTGAGWAHGRWHYDAAYQAQLPATQSVVKSGLQAGEYNNSNLKIWTQSLTLTARVKF